MEKSLSLFVKVIALTMSVSMVNAATTASVTMTASMAMDTSTTSDETSSPVTETMGADLTTSTISQPPESTMSSTVNSTLPGMETSSSSDTMTTSSDGATDSNEMTYSSTSNSADDATTSSVSTSGPDPATVSSGVDSSSTTDDATVAAQTEMDTATATDSQATTLDVNNTLILNCFTCSGTYAECGGARKSSDTNQPCVADEVCWVEVNIKDQTYSRSCAPSCPADRKETLCSGNVCEFCCTTSNCNLLDFYKKNGAQRTTSAMLWLLLVALVPVYTSL